jgi:hypothetical protein
VDGDNGDFVDCDLRNLAESIALGRLDFKPELIRVIAKRRRQRTNHDGRQFREKFTLHNKRWARFAIIPRGRDDHELTAPH